MNNGHMSGLMTEESDGETILCANNDSPENKLDETVLHSDKTPKSNIERQMKLNLESLEKMSLEDKIYNYLSPDRKKLEGCPSSGDGMFARSDIVPYKKRISNCSTDSSATILYLYTDPEKDVQLIETHLPSECGSRGRRSLESDATCCTVDSQQTELYDWRACSKDSGTVDPPPPSVEIPERIASLSDRDLRENLKELGDDPGPITQSTRQTYLIRLHSLESDPGAVRITKGLPGTFTLILALSSNLAVCPSIFHKSIKTYKVTLYTYVYEYWIFFTWA